MNVRDLIEELKTFDEDLEVVFVDSEWGNTPVNKVALDNFEWLSENRRPKDPVVYLSEGP